MHCFGMRGFLLCPALYVSTFSLDLFFSGSSPEPFTFDLLSIDPFPIIVQNGALVTIAAQVTLNQVMEVGTKVALNLVLEGFIPIKIPCLDLDGVNIRSW